MLLPILLYLGFGFIFITWLGRRGVITVVSKNLWALLWFLWPLILILIAYLVLNAIILLTIYWGE